MPSAPCSVLLDPALKDLPEDLGGEENRRHRERLARHLVQRRRGDIATYLHTDTPFPEREQADVTYTLTPEYRRLFDKAVNFARESYQQAASDSRRQRVHWWSALGLLRSLGSSPAAAAATCRAGRRTRSHARSRRPTSSAVARCSTRPATKTPRASTSHPAPATQTATRRTAVPSPRSSATRRSAATRGSTSSVAMPSRLPEGRTRSSRRQSSSSTGYSPMGTTRSCSAASSRPPSTSPTIFASTWPSDARTPSRSLPSPAPSLRPSVRSALPSSLRFDRHVLVATDCLSEGINLQEDFDAVVHYDLSWNPTRHEQREGRVDRYGQTRANGPDRHVLRCELTDRRDRA